MHCSGSSEAHKASVFYRACLGNNFKTGLGAHQTALLFSMDCWSCPYIWFSVAHWAAEMRKTRGKKTVFLLSKNFIAKFCIPGKLTVWADKSSVVFMNMCIICCRGRRYWQEAADVIPFVSVHWQLTAFKSSFFFTLDICPHDSGEYMGLRICVRLMWCSLIHMSG